MNQKIIDWGYLQDKPRGFELIGLHKEIVCNECEEDIYFAMSELSMVKDICLSVYFDWLDKIPVWQIVLHLSRCFCLSESSIYKYLPSRGKNVKYIAVKQCFEGDIVARYGTVKEAAESTGIKARNIYLAIEKGWKAGGFMFEAQCSLPVIQ